MPYVTQNDLAGLIPPPFLLAALDDDQDGVADAGVWDAIAGQADGKVDAFLGQRFSVPFSEPPQIVLRAARIFAAAALYRRRDVPNDRNPYADEERRMEEKLSAIAAGKEPLTTEAAPASDPAVLITEPSKTFSDGRLMS